MSALLIPKPFQNETRYLILELQPEPFYSDNNPIGGFIKNFLIIFALAAALPVSFVSADVIRDDRGGSYVPFQDFKLSLTDSLFELFAGKFEEVKKSYCVTNAKQACRKQIIMQICKMNVNQSGGSCPDACKAWAKDCQNASDSELRKRFGDDLEDE